MKLKWPVLIFLCIVAISVGFYVTWSKKVPEKIVQAARNQNIPVDDYIRLKDFLTKATEGTLTSAEFDQLVELSKQGNDSTRLRAFNVMGNCNEEPMRSRAIEEVARMQDDPSQAIKDNYAWTLYQLKAPNWREEFAKNLESPDPAVRALAERQLGE